MERQVRTLLEGAGHSKDAREELLEVVIVATRMQGDAWEWFVALLAAATM